MNFKNDDAPFANNAEAISFKGVFYHTNVRKDKFDWPFTPSLKAIIAKCSSSNPPQTEAKADATKVEATTPETPKTEAPKPQTPAAVKPAAKPAVKVVPRMAPAKKSKSLFESVISLIIQLFVNKKH